MFYHVKISGRTLDTKTTSIPQHNTTPQNQHFWRMDLGPFTSENKMTTTPLCLPQNEAFVCMITEGKMGIGPGIISGGRNMDYRQVQKLPLYLRPFQSIRAIGKSPESILESVLSEVFRLAVKDRTIYIYS
jgi:hypothetical protein